MTYISKKYKFGDKNYKYWKAKNFESARLGLYNLELLMPYYRDGEIKYLSKEEIDSLLKNGYSTLSLGYVGVYEMTQAMLGVSHTTKEGEEFALKVMHHLNNTCQTWKKETRLGFGLYGTPGESLTSRFCRIDKQKFGEIKNVTDRMYYTNSYHVHVTEEMNAFDKLKFEAQFQELSPGGAISYIETPNLTNNLDAVTTKWLEDYLIDFENILIIVSHLM